MKKQLYSIVFTLFLVLSTVSVYADEDRIPVDTSILVDRVQVSAIKQGMVLRSEALSSTIVGERDILRGHVEAMKNLSHTVPNLLLPDYGSRMTSSIYVRGLGARIDQPVMGLNVDNVPVMNKNAFDMELSDVERIEVLRGPQSMLYGRNTMGGVVNIYTLSPMTYQGVRFGAEYSSGDSYRFRVATYQKLSEQLGVSVSGFYNRQGGFFTNQSTGKKCDWEQMGGGRWKIQWRGSKGWSIDNTFSASRLKQGGYAYAYVGDDLLDETGKKLIGSGEISYNDPSNYERTALSNGLTLRYDAPRFTISSITSYQFTDDCMNLDQDFLPLSYFTLQQALREHSVTEDVVIRSRHTKHYDWLFGAFGFYRHGKMSAPVTFQKTGIDRLIFGEANKHMAPMGMHIGWDVEVNPEEVLPLYSDFKNPSYGLALYHESKLRWRRWVLTAGLRVEREHTELQYSSRADLPYVMSIRGQKRRGTVSVNDTDRLKHTYTEVLPKFSLMYSFDAQRNIYFSIARGYKAGGFNTQIFSDILQDRIKTQMMPGGQKEQGDVMSYRPEYSWNYELGGHFSCMEGGVRGDFALFYIDVEDQQLTVFPQGQNTGRMMTNAGQTHSYGAEFSLLISPWHNVEIHTAYGYTHAQFQRYIDGKNDYRGKFVPYAPQHTLSLTASWSIATGVRWLGDLVLRGGLRSAGKIYWNEANTLSQPFYTLYDASLRFEQKHYSIDFWGRNLSDRTFDVFYFKSIGNEFVQRGHPRCFGVTLTLTL